MTSSRDEQDTRELFEQAYSPARSRAAHSVERLALGHDVGLNGYTTVDQAEVLRELVELTTNDVVLDLGSGRGWPGSHVARMSGCRLTATDIPLSALAAAKSNMAADGSGTCDAVAAEGGALPFAAASFDAIIHADVFC